MNNFFGSISVVIPVRNGMPYLPETVNSVLPQLSDDDELIIHENFSSDGTVEYLEELAKQTKTSKIKIIHANKPLSAAENWTQAVLMSKGKYTKILCADDLVLAGALDIQRKEIASNDKCVLVSSRRKIINSNGKTIISARGLKGLIGEFNGGVASRKALLSSGNPFGETSAVLYDTNSLVAELPFTSAFPYVTDLDMHIKVLRHGEFIGISDVGFAFRVHQSSWSADLRNSQFREYVDWIKSQAIFLELNWIIRFWVTSRVYLFSQLRKLIM